MGKGTIDLHDLGKKRKASGRSLSGFAYVKNKEAELADVDHEVSGMLLYAKTDEEIQPDGVYQMSGNQISVRTLDLNSEFSEIAAQLDGIVEAHFGKEAACVRGPDEILA